jgi:uncharacterized protein YbjT (DUF2867 family)
MNPTIILIGSTGLIGNTFLDFIKNDDSFEIIALTRREIPSIKDSHHIKQEIINFDHLEKHKQLITGQALICALGTTIKKAGSQENFRHVDYQLPLEIAKYASENGCQNFILISSMGADPSSKIFYNRVKGELERDIQKLSFISIHIIRPSLLLGDRQEFRLGEEIGKIFLKAFRFLIPAKYRPVHAMTIASKIYALLRNPTPGIHIYEGKQIYN